MITSYEDVFLSDIMKQILGLYKLENPSVGYDELVNSLSIGKLKQLYHDLSKDSRGILDLPVTLLFNKDDESIKSALIYLKYQHFYGETHV